MKCLRKSFLYTLILFNIATRVVADTPILDRKINLSVRNESLENILLVISEQANFSFSYNPDIIPVDSVMTVNIRNSTVREVLSTLLGDDIDFNSSGNHQRFRCGKWTS